MSGSWRSWYDQNVAGIGAAFAAAIGWGVNIIVAIAAWWAIWRLAVKFFHWINSP